MDPLSIPTIQPDGSSLHACRYAARFGSFSSGISSTGYIAITAAVCRVNFSLRSLSARSFPINSWQSSQSGSNSSRYIVESSGNDPVTPKKVRWFPSRSTKLKSIRSSWQLPEWGQPPSAWENPDAVRKITKRIRHKNECGVAVVRLWLMFMKMSDI